jgi:hypothetical protein
MTKKKFGLSSTLSKNKVEEVSLPEKVELTKTTKDIDAVKERVEAIHEIPDLPLSMVEEPVVRVETVVTVRNEDTPDNPQKTLSNDTYSIEAVSTQKPQKKAKVGKKNSEIKGMAGKHVRITVDTPKNMHTKLKIRAIEGNTTIRDYIIQLIEKDLN